MRILPGIFVLFFVLTSLSVVAQGENLRSSARLEIPCKHRTRVSSPSGRYSLVGFTRQQKMKGKCSQCKALSSKLWLDDSVTHVRTLLLEVNRSASSGWSPDGKSFYVEDDFGSNGTESYLYEISGLKKLDIGELIDSSDKVAKSLSGGHAYVRVEHWQDSKSLLVRFQGHTDEAPSTCFDFHYLVSRSGNVKKLSEQTGSPDATWCRF